MKCVESMVKAIFTGDIFPQGLVTGEICYLNSNTVPFAIPSHCAVIGIEDACSPMVKYIYPRALSLNEFGIGIQGHFVAQQIGRKLCADPKIRTFDDTADMETGRYLIVFCVCVRTIERHV
jgi:hypothetical protein